MNLNRALTATENADGRLDSVCYHCGYARKGLDASVRCPECGVVPPQEFREELGRWRVTGHETGGFLMISVVLLIATYFCIPVFLQRSGADTLPRTHPAVWAFPGVIFLAGVLALAFVRTTWPPPALGIAWIWKTAVALSGLVLILSVSMAVEMYIFGPNPHPSDGAPALMVSIMIMVLLTASAMGLLATLARCMSWISLHVDGPRRARAWRWLTRWSATAAFALLLGAMFIAIDPIDPSAIPADRGPGLIAMNVAVVSVVASLYLALRNSLFTLVARFRSKEG